MKRTHLSAAGLAALLHLAGCDRETATQAPAAPPVEPTAQVVPPAVPSIPSSGTPGPVPGTRITAVDTGSPEEMIADWRQALETHDYEGARSYYGHGGQANGINAAEFAAAWGKYRIIDITVGKGVTEGAAGSLYYEAPVSVTGLRRDGKPYYLSGTLTLRRVNDVDGATPEQLRWHIESSTLQP